MGVFTVPVELRNWQNQFLPPADRGQELSCDAFVDSGAAELALPAEMVEQSKLQELDTVCVYTADGGEHE